MRKLVRRLRWFRTSFREQLERIAAQSGVRYRLDERRLTAAFLDWLRAFEAQKPRSPRARRAYVGFAAGLMLQSLVRHAPLSVEALPEEADRTNPAYFWPEGYVYVAYCLTIRAAVLQQEFHEDLHTAPELHEIRSWWSFRENVEEDAELAIAFLDLFAGDVPNWSMPSFFCERQVRLAAPRFFRRTDDDRGG